MKPLRNILAFMLLYLLSAIGLRAQHGMEDVVYLKNGSIFRGTIIEQVPNVSIKVKIMGGNIMAVGINEIEKITKEEKQIPAVHHERYHDAHTGLLPDKWNQHRDTSAQEFSYRNRGKFMIIHVLFDNKQGGVHLVKGYKFNQHAALGFGVGVDYVFSSPFNRKINDLNKKALAGFYVPIFFHLTGDMFPARVSPFYAVEAGYAIGRLDKREDDMDSFRKPDTHGAYGMLGLGVKFSGKFGRYLSILFNMNVKNVNYKERETRYDANGNTYRVTENKNATLLIPGVRLGFGFTAKEGKAWHHPKRN